MLKSCRQTRSHGEEREGQSYQYQQGEQQQRVGDYATRRIGDDVQSSVVANSLVKSEGRRKAPAFSLLKGFVDCLGRRHMLIF